MTYDLHNNKKCSFKTLFLSKFDSKLYCSSNNTLLLPASTTKFFFLTIPQNLGMIQTCQTQRMIVTPVKALSITANKWK